MNKSERAYLDKRVKRLEKIIHELEELSIQSIDPGSLRAGPKVRPKIGQRVRVYAACADMHGLFLDGNIGVIVSTSEDRNSEFARAVKVRLVEDERAGEEYSVHPEQCQLVDEKKGSRK